MDRVKSVNKVFLATVIISIAGAFINEFIYGITDNYILVLLSSQLLLIIPSAAYLYYYKINVLGAIRFHKIRLSNIILIIIFSYLITPLMSLISALSMLVAKNETADFMNEITTNNSFLVSLIFIAFIPCILEESVYRGVFYNEYRKISPLKAIFLSAFLFGMIHGNLNQFSYAFAMGIVFALLIEATDSILATMIVHFCINGTSVLTLYLYPKLFRLLESLYGSQYYNADELIKQMTSASANDTNLAYAIEAYALPALICSVLAFIVFRTIAKNSGRWEYVKNIFKGEESITQDKWDKREEWQSQNEWNPYGNNLDNDVKAPEKKRLITVSLIAGIIICVILIVLNELTPATVQEQSSQEFYTIINSVFGLFK